jgi:hypothetical protein
MAHHEGHAGLTVNVGLTASVQGRHNLVWHHLWNARRAARLCREREEVLTQQDYRLPDVEQNGTAMVAVMSAAAFLEALVNEVFLDTADPSLRSSGLLDGISQDGVAVMSDKWTATPSAEREGILEKYKLAIRCVSATMDFGRAPAQSVQLLIELRDGLTHYKPEWQGDGTNLYADLRRKLPVNPRVAEVNPWFPHQALSADLAEWSCNQSVAFAKEWWGAMGLTRDPPLDGQPSWPQP